LGDPSHADRPAHDARWRLRSYVMGRHEFNKMRSRLPRAVRRRIEPARDGHVGLVVQAVAGDQGEAPLAALFDNTPAFMAEQRLRELADEMTDLFA
jgi:hypothetical protein